VAARLVAELADAWMAGAKAEALTPATAARQSVVIRRLGEFLTEDADRFLTLSGDGTEVARRLHDWESEMVNRFPPPSVHAKKLGMTLRNHVARDLQSNGVVLRPGPEETNEKLTRLRRFEHDLQHGC
jgi:hypothetical protein